MNGGAGIFWIASYPKSGNTWIRCLIASLKSGGEAPELSLLGDFCPNSASCSWIEEMSGVPVEDMTAGEIARLRAAAYLDAARRAAHPLFLKTHDAFDERLFPAAATRGAVHMVRDPRDVAPSLADHMGLSLDEAIAIMNQPDFTLSRLKGAYRPQAGQRLGAWPAHVEGWLAADCPRLLLRYEDLLAEPEREIRRLAEFLGLGADTATLRRAGQACGFGALRAAEERGGFRERTKFSARFFRKGRAGGWRETLSAEQSAQIAAAHGPAMQRLGYDAK